MPPKKIIEFEVSSDEESTESSKDVKVADSKIKSGLSPAPLLIDFSSDPKLLKNPILSPTERLSIRETITEDRNHIIFLLERIESKKNRIELMEKRMKNAEKCVLIGEHLQQIIQNRINENTARLTKFSESMYLDVMPNDIDMSPTAHALCSIISDYRREEEAIRKAQEEDTNRLNSLVPRIRSWSDQVSADKFLVCQERRTLGMLQTSHNQLVSVIAEKEKMISSSHLLPDEILLKILRYVMDNGINTIREDISAPQDHSAMKLSWICARWRTLVLSVPSMWVYVPMSPVHEDSVPYSGRNDHYFRIRLAHLPIVIHWPLNGPWKVKSRKRLQEFFGKASTKKYIVCTDLLGDYLCRNTEARSFLDNAKTVELIGRNIGFSVTCQIVTQCYIIRELTPQFTLTVAAKLSSLTIFVPEMTFQTLSGVLKQLSQLCYLRLCISKGFISGPIDTVAITSTICPRLAELSASPSVVSNVIGTVIEAPNLTCLELEEQACEQITANHDLWEACAHQANMRTKISRLKLAGFVSEDRVRTEVLPRLAGWAGVTHLLLRGRNLAPILEAMRLKPAVLLNVEQLSLEETNISGDIIRRTFDSRKNSGRQDEKVCRTIDKLVLNRCQGVDRAFCEDMMQRIDEMAVYC